MGKGRLEAFSDGVIAIIITIMVLELKVPHGDGVAALAPTCPVFIGYVMSYLYVAIYWNNHHHLLHTVKTVTPGVMWSNMLLLFWLSLFPFVTAWAGALSWLVLQRAIIAGGGSLGLAIGTDFKGKISAVAYASGIAGAFVDPWISQALFAAVALVWIVPDRRIARLFGE